MSEAAQLSAALADRYRIERELGAGGMATVYLAEDLKHHRKVAIKVLREDLAASLGATRFLREIEIAAQLQHPNILPLLDSGDAGGLLYYVMPYVTGHSLRERLAKQGELPVSEAVRLISEVLDALAHAHAHGVVHRDIKPDNVMLSGRHALVADFGVARAVSEASAARKMTTGGVALGTPAYMSPEQASADPNVDHRADIYAVGAMAYELLTGRPPFTGTTAAQVLAAHVQTPPEPMTKYRAAIPAPLEQIVMKCLAKRPADRWQTAEELLPLLEQLMTPTMGLTPTSATPLPVPGTRKRYLLIGVPTAAVVVLVGVLVFRRDGAPEFRLGQPQRITAEDGLEVQQAISPDGKRVAYAAGTSTRLRIFVRDLAGGYARPLTDDSTANQQFPRWSPADSATILFISRGGAFVAPAGGGAARQVIPAPGVATAAWSPDGKAILFRRSDSLFVQDVGKGEPHVVARGGGFACDWSPRGGLIACASLGPYTAGQNFGNLAPSSIVVYSLATGVRIRVTDSVTINQSPVWSPDGKHLYFVSTRQGTSDVYALAISAAGRPVGLPQRVTTGLNAAAISLSPDGRRLVYSVYSEISNIWTLAVPAQPPANASAMKQVTFGRQVIESVRISRDGKWLLYDSDRDGSPNVYRVSSSGGEPERLTTDSVHKFSPDLSPDGQYVAFHSFLTGTRDVFVLPLNGGALQQITSTRGAESYPVWSPDGHTLAFYDQNAPVTSFGARRGSNGHWQAPTVRAQGVSRPAWSPDGRMLVGMAGGRVVVFSVDSGAVRSVYTPRLLTSDPSPEWPHWPEPHTIYFKSHSGGRTSFWSVPAAGGVPRLLVRFEDPARQSYRGDWDTDGKRFFFPVQDRQSDLWMVELLKR